MVEDKKERYIKKLKKYGPNYRALRWTTKEAQEVRFKELLKDIGSFNGKSILDVGCGFGGIIPHLKKVSKDFFYTGVDLIPEFIEIAKRRYPKEKFLVRDYFKKPLKENFDVVISSGTLNANVKDPIGFRKKAIKTMWEHTKKILAFNMAVGFPQPRNKSSYKVWYANSLEILKYCLSLTSKLIFRHHYRKKDFTVIMFK